MDQASIQLDDTRLTPPSGGVVSKKNVEVGQLVQPGQPLMSVVPMDDVWVVANLKETEIRDVNPGDKVDFTVDAYPGVHFQGTVDSLAAATGSQFSLLPPDNATGNFTKVVQRIPVKILVDGGQNPTPAAPRYERGRGYRTHQTADGTMFSSGPMTTFTPEEVYRNRFIIAITVTLASVLELLDTSIVNVAIPHMMGNLGATLDEIAWVSTGYVVANVIVLPISGWLSDKFGRQRYFAASIILFTVASFFCGSADSLTSLCSGASSRALAAVACCPPPRPRCTTCSHPRKWGYPWPSSAWE